MNRLKMIGLIVLIITISSPCLGYQIELDLNKNQSSLSGTTNMKLTNGIVHEIMDDTVDSIRFKMFVSYPSMYYTIGIGHEIYGHGFVARRYDLNPSYQFIKPHIDYDDPNSPYEKLDIIVGGTQFDRKLEDLYLKDSVMNDYNYRKSMILFGSKLSYFSTMYNSDGSDFDTFIEYSKKVNPKTKIEKYLQHSINSLLLDPSLWINNYILTETFIRNIDLYYTMKFIPTVDFDIYSTAVTNSIGFSSKIDDHYLKLNYEFGHDIWNRNINGFKLEFTNIKVNDYFNLDINIHHIDKCESNGILTFNFENLFIKWKHNLKYDELEGKNRFSIGWCW